MINLTEDRLLTATVVGIHWERIIVSIDVKLEFAPGVDASETLQFYAVNGLFEAKAQFDSEFLENGLCRLTLNLTNPGNVRCLPAGTYNIVVCRGENILTKCVVEPSYTPRLDDCSRNFLYSGRKNVYTVTFLVSEGEDDLPFIMCAMASKRCGIGFPSNPQRTPKKMNGIAAYKKKKFRPLMRWLYGYYSARYANEKKTVLFMTEQSSTLGTNLTAVRDRMKARGLHQEYTILESARMASSVPQSVKSWIALIKKLARSQQIFVDDHAPVLDWLKLREGTEIYQLWHAGAGFKSSGYSRWGHIGCPAPSSAHRQYTYGIAGSRHIAHFFSEVWGINTERVLPTGMPRIDEYLDKDYRAAKEEELYREYPMCKGKKVVLFAPTYRGKNRADAHYPYELIDFDRLYKWCGEERVVLFKMHPWVSASVPIPEQYRDRMVDVNQYPNINDLFYITDLLISDYSSNIFEYSLMKKPMLFFAFDKIQYSFSRGFHRDYELSAPGKVCYTFDELMTAMETKDFEYEKVEEYVTSHFDYIDSNASDRVIDWLLLGQIPEEFQKAIRAREERAEAWTKLDFSVMIPPEEDEVDDTEEKDDDKDAKAN